MGLNLPKKFNDLYNLLNNMYLFKNILIVNTEITGNFLDKMCLDKKTIRIKYSSTNFHDFITQINNIIVKFD